MFRTFRIISLFSVLTLFALVFAAAPPAAHAQSTTAFTGEYFNNISLSGTPVLVRDDPAINFDWGNSSPDSRIPADNFSVRWTRWYYINAAASYTFTVTSDDGSRLWVDGAILIDMWWDHAPLARASTISLTTGYHLIRMEYYEHSGGALAQLSITSAASFPDWKGEYYSNQTLSDSPTLTVDNIEINFNWGTGSPDPSIPSSHFSVRWTRNQWFDAGTYQFKATTDDGMRVWVGGTLLIDQWHDQSPTPYAANLTLAAGTYPLRVEYYQNTGGAVAILAWAPVPTGGTGWTGKYFNNASLTGGPVFIRSDPALSFNWGTSGPGGGIAPTNFSAEWDSAQNAPVSTFYSVFTMVDDGVRVWVDGNLVVDQWHDQAPTTFAATVYLSAGLHNWHVEYYQHFGGAQINVQIVPGVSPLRPLPLRRAVTLSSTMVAVGGSLAAMPRVGGARADTAAIPFGLSTMHSSVRCTIGRDGTRLFRRRAIMKSLPTSPRAPGRRATRVTGSLTLARIRSNPSRSHSTRISGSASGRSTLAPRAASMFRCRMSHTNAISVIRSYLMRSNSARARSLP